MRADHAQIFLIFIGAALLILLYYMHRAGHLQSRAGKIAAVLGVVLLGALAMFLPFLGLFQQQ